MEKNILEKIVSRLELNRHADELARKAIIGGLTGEAATTTVVVDVPYQGRRYLVLGAIPQHGGGGEIPLLVETTLGPPAPEVAERLQQLGWIGRENQLTTEEVAGWFRGRCNGLGEETAKFPQTWAAAAKNSFAPVTIAGDLGQRVATTGDQEWESNSYSWFDLEEIPVGGSVYRISTTRTLWLFTRREAGWEVTVVPDVSWATTSGYLGGQSIGTLIEGAFLALED